MVSDWTFSSHDATIIWFYGGVGLDKPTCSYRSIQNSSKREIYQKGGALPSRNGGRDKDFCGGSFGVEKGSRVLTFAATSLEYVLFWPASEWPLRLDGREGGGETEIF